MLPDPFRQALRNLLATDPFLPFVIELVSGPRFLVRHVEAVLLVDDLVVFGETDNTTHFFDAATVSRLFTLIPPPPDDPATPF